MLEVEKVLPLPMAQVSMKETVGSIQGTEFSQTRGQEVVVIRCQ